MQTPSRNARVQGDSRGRCHRRKRGALRHPDYPYGRPHTASNALQEQTLASSEALPDSGTEFTNYGTGSALTAPVHEIRNTDITVGAEQNSAQILHQRTCQNRKYLIYKQITSG